MTPLPNDVRARVLCFMDAESSTTSEVMDQRLAVSDLLRAYDEAVAEVAKATPTIDEQLNAHRLELVGEVERLAAENARLREAWKTRAPYLSEAPITGSGLAAKDKTLAIRARVAAGCAWGTEDPREVRNILRDCAQRIDPREKPARLAPDGTAKGAPAHCHDGFQGCCVRSRNECTCPCTKCILVRAEAILPSEPKPGAPAVEASDAIDRGEQWGHAIGRHDEFCIYTADAVFGPRAHCDSQATADRIVDGLNGFEEAVRLLRESSSHTPDLTVRRRIFLARLDAKGGSK